MTLLAPWLLLLAALAIPLTLAFLHRKRLQRRAVPSLVLLRGLKEDQPRKRSFAVPHHWLALTLCLLAMAAVAFAAADPTLEGEGPRTWVVVVDTTASMGAVHDGDSRLERGVDRLQEALEGLGGRDEVALVTHGSAPQVRLSPTADRDRLREALAALRPTGSAEDEGQAAFTLASALCRQEERGTILLVTDGAHMEVPALPCPVQLVPVGEDAANAAITAFTARETDSFGQVEVYVEVLNASRQRRVISVDIEVDGTLAEVVSLGVGAGERVGEVVTLEAQGGERLKASLHTAGEDALAADDHAWAIRDLGSRSRVLLVTTSPSGFVAEALRLHPRAELETAAPDAVDASSGPFDLVVLEAPVDVGVLPEASHVALMGPPPSTVGMASSEPVERPPVLWWDFDHPLLYYVDLDRVQIEQATPVAPLEGDEVLARTDSEGALVTLREQGGRKWLLFGFAPSQSDLVLRMAFANLVANVVEWSVQDRSERAALVMGTGQVVDGARPGWTLTRMGHDSPPQSALAPVADAGLYALSGADGELVRQVAVNLTSTRESTLTPSAELPNTSALSVTPGSWWSELWRLPVVLALLLLAVEWLLPMMRRRRRRRRTALPSPSRSPRTEPGR